MAAVGDATTCRTSAGVTTCVFPGYDRFADAMSRRAGHLRRLAIAAGIPAELLPERHTLLLTIVGVSLVGAAVAKATVPALIDLDHTPPLAVALIWPAFTASLVAAATVPVQQVLRATGARSLVVSDLGFLTCLLVVAVVATVPGAMLSGSPTGVLRNLLGLSGLAVALQSATGSRVLGTLGPWFSIAAASIFGLDNAALGEIRWRWWAWLVDADASSWWACGLLALAYCAVALRATRFARGALRARPPQGGLHRPRADGTPPGGGGRGRASRWTTATRPGA